MSPGEDTRTAVLRPDVEIVDHGSWLVAAAPPGGGFVRLSPAEARWLRTGPHPGGPPDLAGHDKEDERDDLIRALSDQRLLVGTELDLRRFRATRDGIELCTSGGWLATGYRYGLRHLFHPAAVAVAAVVGLAGAVALIAQLSAGRPLATVTLDPFLAVLVLLLLDLVATAMHETAHGLVLARHGRRIRRAGLGFYWGGVCCYVDAGEALLLPRRVRAVQSAAGPATDVVLAGAASLLALTFDGPFGAVLLLYAVFLWLDVVLNLVPFLELDGYWVLADMLDRPTLRAEAAAAARAMLGPERRVSRLGVYGVLSTGFGVLLLVGSAAGWWFMVGDLLRALTEHGPLGWLLVVPVALPVVMGWISLLLQAGVAMRRPRPGTGPADATGGNPAEAGAGAASGADPSPRPGRG